MKANKTQKVPKKLSDDTFKLYDAVTKNDLAKVQRYAKINRIFALIDDKTIFTHACEKYIEIKMLPVDKDGIKKCLEEDSTKIIKRLIEVIKNAINQIYPNGGTPLMDVIKTGSIGLVVEAIHAGANVNQPVGVGVNKKFPLQEAREKPETRICLLLEAHNAKVELESDNAKVKLEPNEELSNPKNLKQKTSFRYAPLLNSLGITRNPKRNSLPEPLTNDNDNHVEKSNTPPTKWKNATKNVPSNLTTTATSTLRSTTTTTQPQTPPEDYGFKF